MAIRVEWESKEKTVLRMIYEEDWNWRDHQIALDVVNTLMSTVCYPVDLIVDLNGSILPADATPDRAQRPLSPNWSGRAIMLTDDTTLAQTMLGSLPQPDFTVTPTPC